MEPLQAMVDGMNAAFQKERAKSQMTLGQMIERLKQLPPDLPMTNLSAIRSYRGYYCDLSFSVGNGTRPVKEVLEMCQGAMGKEFTGYKGGEFLMGESTPLWLAEYGESSGFRIQSITDEGKILGSPEEDDD